MPTNTATETRPVVAFVVTLNTRTDSADGLRRMTLAEAEKLVAFTALRGITTARILAVVDRVEK